MVADLTGLITRTAGHRVGRCRFPRGKRKIGGFRARGRVRISANRQLRSRGRDAAGLKPHFHDPMIVSSLLSSLLSPDKSRLIECRAGLSIRFKLRVVFGVFCAYPQHDWKIAHLHEFQKTGLFNTPEKKLRAIWTNRPFRAESLKVPGAGAVVSMYPGATPGTCRL